MEFKKIPPPPGSGPGNSQSGSLPGPAEQLRTALRLMAGRHLYGSRGILFLLGSVVFVFSGGRFLSDSGIMGNHAGGSRVVLERWAAGGLSPDDWASAAGMGIGLVILLCGWFILKKPRAAALLAFFLLITRGISLIVAGISDRPNASLGTALLYLVLGAVAFRTVRDAFGFHREASGVRERFRAAAMVENLERKRAAAERRRETDSGN